MNFAEKVLRFITTLDIAIKLPDGVYVMDPFQDILTVDVCKQFYQKFYTDDSKRWMIIGINPGRFGGGVTGIPFTDPIRLQKDAGIENEWPKKQELSSIFIYDMINAYGGARTFYNKFYFSAVSPLGFTRNGKNLNYYDDIHLQDLIKPLVVDWMTQQLKFGIHTKAAFCLGEGKNYSFLTKLNTELKFFEDIIPLAHPRFIMQYRLKRKDEYIRNYIQQFNDFVNQD